MNKRLFYIPMVLLAVASCEKVQEELGETPEEITPAGATLVVNANVPDTKVTISEDGDAYKMSWDGDEEATLILRRYSSWDCKPYHSTSSKLTGESMSFSFEGLDYGTGTIAYDILYPQSAYIDKNVRDAYVALPVSQTPNASTADPSAALLYGRATGPEEYGAYASPQSTIDVLFEHMAAYGKMTLTGVPSEETISSIAITAEDSNIAGEIIYHAHSGTIDYNRTSESTITLNGTNLTANPAGFDVWFACKPFTLEAGKTLTIVTTTSAGVHTSVLSAKVDIVFAAGIVTEFPATSDTYTVTFDTQGGSVVAPKVVRKGYTVSAPANPTKDGSLAEGLYLGDIEDAEEGAMFAGWYTDSDCTSAYDFSTPITGNLTLYAKWDAHVPIDLSGYPQDTDAWNAGNHYPYRGLSYVNAQALGEETHYTIIMNGNCTVWSGDVTLNNANAVVRIIGKTSERTISRSGCYTCFKVTAGTLIFGKNLKCKYTGGQDYPFADVNGAGATLVFDDGCTFDGDGCTLPASSGIINVNGSGAKFILDGGSFVNNTVSYRLVNVKNAASQFIVRDGNISGNTFNGVLFETFYGSSRDHIFVMEGGSISGNTFTTSLINIKSSTSEILIQGGEITGNTANTDAAQAAPICVTNGRLEISGVEISGNSVTSTTGTGNVAGAILIVGWANNADSNFYVNKTSGVIESNTASRSVAAESTGFKADQMLYVQKTGDAAGFKKKRDAAVADVTSFTSNPYASFWSDAASE